MSNREKIERDASGNITKIIRYDAKGNLMFTHVSDWEIERYLVMY